MYVAYAIGAPVGTALYAGGGFLAFAGGRVVFGHLPDRIGGTGVSHVCVLIESAGQAFIWLAFVASRAGLDTVFLVSTLVVCAPPSSPRACCRCTHVSARQRTRRRIPRTRHTGDAEVRRDPGSDDRVDSGARGSHVVFAQVERRNGG